MIEVLIQFLITILVIGLLYWLITALPIPPPFKQIATVVVIIICIIWVLYMLLPLTAGGPHFHISR
jgi:hypothetical protein